MEPPPADWQVDERTVRELLRRQLPAHADDRLQLTAEGFDAWIYRLGDEHVVRVPRRLLSAPGIAVEQRWLPELAPRLPLPVPAPLLAGRPEAGVFDHPWTVSRWLPGHPVDRKRVSPSQSPQLARFLAALHDPAPAAAPDNPFRSGPLGGRLADLMQRAGRVRDKRPDVASLVDAAVEVLQRAARRDGFRPTWIHGDLHPYNVLMDEGRFSGVLDWIDLTAGDPALDVHVVWWFWPPARQDSFWATYPHDDALRERSRGWAVFFGLLFLDFGGDDDDWRALATQLLEHVVGR